MYSVKTNTYLKFRDYNFKTKHENLEVYGNFHFVYKYMACKCTVNIFLLHLENRICCSVNLFPSEFLWRIIPSLNLDISIIANRNMSKFWIRMANSVDSGETARVWIYSLHRLLFRSTKLKTLSREITLTWKCLPPFPFGEFFPLRGHIF